MGNIIGKLLGAGLELLGTEALKLIRRAQRKSLPEVDVVVSEPPQPLTYKDVEHQRAQMTASIEAAKREEAARRAAASSDHEPAPDTQRLPKPGNLPKK